jgi:hypothetical protein
MFDEASAGYPVPVFDTGLAALPKQQQKDNRQRQADEPPYERVAYLPGGLFRFLGHAISFL